MPAAPPRPQDSEMASLENVGNKKTRDSVGKKQTNQTKPTQNKTNHANTNKPYNLFALLLLLLLFAPNAQVYTYVGAP